MVSGGDGSGNEEKRMSIRECSDERGDAESMLLAAAGDHAAFASIVSEHQGAVYGYLRARLLQDTDVEDLTQEVFVRCYQGLSRFDPDMSVRPWLFGIARNLLREHLRKLKRRKEVAWTGLCLDLESVVEPQPDLHDEALEHLPTCVDGLGDSAKTALNLHYGGKMRLAKIGEKLRRSEGAIKLLMFRARKALRSCLGGKLGDDGRMGRASTPDD